MKQLNMQVWPTALRKLLASSWHADPDRRPSAGELAVALRAFEAAGGARKLMAVGDAARRALLEPVGGRPNRGGHNAMFASSECVTRPWALVRCVPMPPGRVRKLTAVGDTRGAHRWRGRGGGPR